MKKTVIATAMIFAALCAGAQQVPEPRPEQKAAKPEKQALNPTYSDVRYGDHERNVFDLWIAPSDKSTPLAIYVHGGGFQRGDKSKITGRQLRELLDAGISVASVNYRYCNGESDGAMASIDDVRRALQYMRSRAGEWNIDKSHVGMWGTSAGAGATAWIAFHDDVADPESADPVLRESSRLQAACLIGVQTTYDTFTWPALFQLSETDNLMVNLHNGWTVHWLGIESTEDKDTPHGINNRERVNLISLMSSDDPPFMVNNDKEGAIPPKVFGAMVHHPLFAKMYYDRARKLGIDCRACTANAPDYNLNDPITPPQFLKEKLLAR